ncbi:hypothetical protein F5148DRAFT_1279246 [Russula earlei]|uniref:Uncharacterized protein n=1 Tax=Russula earlei TaxID=71964 RepID=A0ACC0UN19_9AGAM|nr:hypothetical protein F5148DRAFT_1279246 [Russula earlei]
MHFLHPYYKLDYIELSWGGAEEQVKECAKGNHNAKNWQDEALKVVEETMEVYYKKQLRAEPVHSPTPTNEDQEVSRVLLSEYDCYHWSLPEMDDNQGWALELRQYLKDRLEDVTKSTNDHAILYPTLAWIALNILPHHASSVPCEWLFSASKQTADLHQAALGTKHFEELQILKFAWRASVPDNAAQNSAQIEEVELGEYCEILEAEDTSAEWDELLLDNDDLY